MLILDEPTNDLDTDMLAAIEDLLDSWPGTLLVVSHDRYLVERVTDRQFAILDGHLRDLPRGVDQYLELRRQQSDAAGGAASAEASRPVAAGGAGVVAGAGAGGGASAARVQGAGSTGAGRGRRRGRRGRRAAAQPSASTALTGADRRTAEKELSSIDRRLEKLQAQIAEQHEKLARHDQSDYVGLGVLGDELGALEASVTELETRWLEVSEALEG